MDRILMTGCIKSSEILKKKNPILNINFALPTYTVGQFLPNLRSEIFLDLRSSFKGCVGKSKADRGILAFWARLELVSFCLSKWNHLPISLKLILISNVKFAKIRFQQIRRKTYTLKMLMERPNLLHTMCVTKYFEERIN